MKKLLFIVSVCIAGNCFAQQNPNVQYTRQPVAVTAGPKWLTHTSGTELKDASRCYFTAIGCEALGFILVSVGSSQAAAAYQNNPSNHNSTAGAGDVLLGSGLLITGFVFNIMAWVHINRAGRLMEGTKVSFVGTKNGVGLAFNF